MNFNFTKTETREGFTALAPGQYFGTISGIKAKVSGGKKSKGTEFEVALFADEDRDVVEGRKVWTTFYTETANGEEITGGLGMFESFLLSMGDSAAELKDDDGFDFDPDNYIGREVVVDLDEPYKAGSSYNDVKRIAGN